VLFKYISETPPRPLQGLLRQGRLGFYKVKTTSGLGGKKHQENVNIDEENSDIFILTVSGEWDYSPTVPEHLLDDFFP
jgi:hypothetical protein